MSDKKQSKKVYREPKERVSVTLTESMAKRVEAVASDMGLTRGQYMSLVTGQAVNTQERLNKAVKEDMLRVMLEDMK
ncbi:hypothetical protein PT044_08780, partial [Erysipelothrix rhusiopathiae]|nr:hypothetical protein [Erysipelothrix rhusiopathiae]